MSHALPLTDVSCTSAVPAGEPGHVEALTTAFKALGDPVRLRLFGAIASSVEPVCVCHLPDVGVTQPTVSHHLRRLREAGLVDSERRGTWVHCSPTAWGRQVADAVLVLDGQLRTA